MAKRKGAGIDQIQFEKLCALKHTKEEIIKWFDCTDDEIEAWCVKTYNQNFDDVFSSKRGVGRAPVVIDQVQFEKLCKMFCTEKEIAGWFGCCIETLNQWCNRTYGENFEDIREQFSAFGRISLRRNQLKMSETVPAMAIYLGKQYLGQSDDPRKYEHAETAESKLGTYFEMLAEAIAGDNDAKSDKS